MIEYELALLEYAKFSERWDLNTYLKHKMYAEPLPVITPIFLRQIINEYYINFDKNCVEVENKEHFKTHLHKCLQELFLDKINLSPLSQEFDDFKALLTELRSDTFWNTEKDPLFETESNKDFFNYVMQYFKGDIILYKKVVFSYMFQRMLRIFSGKTALYMLYINEHYNDFTPLTKILSASKINKGYDRLDARNFLFNKAMKNWNKENPLFKKNFEPIDCVV